MRILRLRHGRREARAACGVRRRAARGARARTAGSRGRARNGVPRRRDADVHRAQRARAAADGATARARGHGRGQPGDRLGERRRSAAHERRDARVAGRAELPASLAGRARAAGVAGRRPARRPHAPRVRVRQSLARPRLRHSRPEPRRPRRRPRAGTRARAGAPLVLRARGEAGYALHVRPRGGAGAPGRRDGGVLRAGRRHAHGRGLPLVRDGELLPRRRSARADATSVHTTTSATGAVTTTSALGIGAVSTVSGERRRNLPSLPRYVEALARGETPPRELEPIDRETHIERASRPRAPPGRARRARGRRRRGGSRRAERASPSSTSWS